MPRQPGRCLVRGSINIDEFFHVNDVVRPGETISSIKFERRGGGKGANQAAAVARAGGSVALVGAIGDDGLWHRDGLQKIGVVVDAVEVIKGEPTGRAIIQLTPAGENCIILHKGANFALSESPAQMETHLAGITHLLLQNEIPWQTTLAYLTRAHAQGATTVFNPSPMPSDEQLRTFPWTALSWLLVNEGEAASLLHALGGAAPDPLPAGWSEHHAIARAYATTRTLAHHPSFASRVAIVCTLGAAGVLALVPGVPEPVHLPAAPLEGAVRDTTGAGDCFTGYLVAELMRAQATAQWTHDQIGGVLRRCVQAAGMCVERRGAMESIPAREEVERRLSAV